MVTYTMFCDHDLRIKIEILPTLLFSVSIIKFNMKVPAINFINKPFTRINITCHLNFLDPSLHSEAWHAERNSIETKAKFPRNLTSESLPCHLSLMSIIGFIKGQMSRIALWSCRPSGHPTLHNFTNLKNKWVTGPFSYCKKWVLLDLYVSQIFKRLFWDPGTPLGG